MSRANPQRSPAWEETTAPIEESRPERDGADRLRPRADALADLERERVPDAALPLDRAAPERPAGRLVAVVTVGNRVAPESPRHGDAVDFAEVRPGVRRSR